MLTNISPRKLLLTLMTLALVAPAFAVIRRMPRARQRHHRRASAGAGAIKALDLTGKFDGTIVYPDGDMKGENAKMVITKKTDESSTSEYVGAYKLTLGKLEKTGIIRASKWEPGKSGGSIVIDNVEIKLRPNRDDSDPSILRLLNKQGEQRCFRFCPMNDRGCRNQVPENCKKTARPHTD